MRLYFNYTKVLFFVHVAVVSVCWRTYKLYVHLQPPPPEPIKYNFPTKRILVTRDPKDRCVTGRKGMLLWLLVGLSVVSYCHVVMSSRDVVSWCRVEQSYIGMMWCGCRMTGLCRLLVVLDRLFNSTHRAVVMCRYMEVTWLSGVE